MVTAVSSKHVRNLGKRLKEERESQGHNLAILASQCNLSVTQLTAIERGDSLPFARSQSSLRVATESYAKVLGVDISPTEQMNPLIEDDIYIPEFLRKK